MSEALQLELALGSVYGTPIKAGAFRRTAEGTGPADIIIATVGSPKVLLLPQKICLAGI